MPPGGVYRGDVTDSGRPSGSKAVVVTLPLASEASVVEPNVSYPTMVTGWTGVGVPPPVSVFTVGEVVTTSRPASS